MSRSLLIEMLDKSRAETEIALASLDPNRVIYDDGDWRIKDIIGHLAVREQMAVFALLAYQEKRPYTPPADRDSVNDQQVSIRRNFTTERITQEWTEVRERLKTLILDIPEALIDGNLTFPSGDVGPISQLVQEIVSHEIQHRRDILRVVGEE